MLQPNVNHATAGLDLRFSAMETMGDRIRTLRQSKGWTLEDLASRLTRRGHKVTFSAISQWERGESQNIKLPTFLALVDELGTTHEYLVHGPSEPGGRDSSGKFRTLKPGSGNKP
jgi:transcriptional regulator with XRE-family HTH domain